MGFIAGRIEPVVPALPMHTSTISRPHGVGPTAFAPPPAQAVTVYVGSPAATTAQVQAEPGRTLATTGLVLAYSGLFIGPLGVAGAICGGVAMGRSDGKHGLHALIAGIVTAFLWILFLQSL